MYNYNEDNNATAYSPLPGSTPMSTPPSSQSPKRPRSMVLMGMTILLMFVFGAGLLAGCQIGGSNNNAGATGTSTTLQTGAKAAATVPPLTGNNIEAVREAVIAKVRPAVVEVNVTTGNGGAIGSGVIIDQRGYIVTNDHVVSDSQTIQVVLYDGSQATAQLVGTDPVDDLAVLKIAPKKNMSTATLGDSSKLVVGEDVLAIGNPLGITQTVTSGIVSALGRTVDEGQGGATIPNAIQTDAPINPGNSGGALVDLQGNLVGIPTLTAIDPEFNAPASGVGFAIPSNRVQFIVPQIISNGSVTHTGRAALGIQATSVDPNVAAFDNLSVDHGVLIASLVSGGAAASAGLKAGDVIVQMDNTPINDQQSLADFLANETPGNTVSVHVYRGSQQLTVQVKLGELQA